MSVVVVVREHTEQAKKQEASNWREFTAPQEKAAERKVRQRNQEREKEKE